MDENIADFKAFVGHLGAHLPQLRTHLNNIFEVLPKAHATSAQVQPKWICVKRFLPLVLGIASVAKSVFGKCMGLYNRRQLSQLQEEMKSTI